MYPPVVACHMHILYLPINNYNCWEEKKITKQQKETRSKSKAPGSRSSLYKTTTRGGRGVSSDISRGSEWHGILRQQKESDHAELKTGGAPRDVTVEGEGADAKGSVDSN